MIKAKDIAQHAGVSLATVDRVLNGRAGVSPRTLSRVRASIEELGYVPNPSAVALVKGVKARLLFLIPDGPSTFMKVLKSELAAVQAPYRADQVLIETQIIPAFDPKALCTQLDRVNPAQIDGVALVVSEGHGVRQAIDRLRQAGVYVVTLISDSPTSKRDFFAGIDNLAAGRTAASLMAKFLLPFGAASAPSPGGKIAIVLGSMLLRDHMDRQTGFLQIAQHRLSGFEVLPAIEALDSHEVVQERLMETLTNTPDIVGLYNAAGGVRGVLRVLQDLPSQRRICTIAHELTPITRQGLEDGRIDAILAQDPGHEVRSAVRLLVGLVTRVPPIEGQERISLDILIRENLM